MQVFLLVITGMTVTGAISGVWSRWGKSGLLWLGTAVLLVGVVAFALAILLPAAMASIFAWLGTLAWGSWMLALVVIALVGAVGMWLLGGKAEVR